MNKSIDDLKREYVQYYADVPVQRYAAMFIGRDEDTIIRWRKEDKDFADAVEKSKAEWIRKRVLVTKAEFALERLEKSVFSEKSTVELEVANTLERVDPNLPGNKLLVEKTLEVLMNSTATTSSND